MNQDSNNDVFEDFQFKPLTEGLGFHKKTIDLKSEVNSVGLMDRSDSKVIPLSPDDLFDSPPEKSRASMADLTKPPVPETPAVRMEASVRFDEKEMTAKPSTQRPNIHQPLPREKKEAPKPNVLDRFEPKLNLDFKETKEKSKELNKDVLKQVDAPRYKLISTNMTSAVFDAVVAFTFAILFLVAMITITKVDLVALVFNAKTQLVVQASLVVMYLAILALYLIVGRSIGGATLGEWAFDVHLAETGDKKTFFFPLKVIWRCLLSIATGFVLLPFLSLIFRKDLVGLLSGTRLYQLQ